MMQVNSRSISFVVPMLLLLLFDKVLSQRTLCGGNLGDNIFTDGNFGSGPATIAQTNPNLAPGFTYTTVVPPDDGEYTLTNNMVNWPNNFGTWIRIGDHDPDPQGYMMVVNASFQPGIFYEKTVVNLCENTLYEFSADIINLIRKNTTGHILPSVTFLIDDAVRFTTGQVPQDETWHTYGFTFSTEVGQTAVKLTLRNNAPGGIGNDLALDNIGFRACGPTSSVSIDPVGRICENSIFPVLSAHIDADTGYLQWQVSTDLQVTWQDLPLATQRTYQVQQQNAGQYFFRYVYGNTPSQLMNPKCRIVSEILPVEVVPVEFFITDTICDGNAYSFGDTVLMTTGTYFEMLTASNGCDSMVTLDLVVIPDPHITAMIGVSPPLCAGDSNGLIVVTEVEHAVPPWIFQLDGNTYGPPDFFSHRPKGTYEAAIIDYFGCQFNQTIVMPDGIPVTVNTGPDTTISLGHSVQLTGSASHFPTGIQWSPPDGLSCPSCLVTDASPLVETIYTLTITSKNGCIGTDQVRVSVEYSADIYLPNVFTPNEDDINDAFILAIDPFVLSRIDEISIYDRWGGMIYQKENILPASTIVLWDGTSDDKEVPAGVYVYAVRYTLIDNQQYVLKGDITVIK